MKSGQGQLAAALKPIYQAANADGALIELEAFEKTELGKKYPSTIKAETLDRCNHFTSFPEHIDFAAHLKPDLEVLNGFAQNCREKGWAPQWHEGKMGGVEFAISPSCCYHCYEGM